MSRPSQQKKQILMTGHVLVMAAWEFAPPNNPRDKYDGKDRGRRIPALICTAPLSRVLVANVFVQTRRHLNHNVVDFFLHDNVIPVFRIPIMFVYCVLIDCYTSYRKLISTVQRISETMPHIQTLDVEKVPKFDETEQQHALATALPKTLWSLRLQSYEFYFNVGFVTQLAESCPFLHRLELGELDADACDALFSNEEKLFPNLKMLTVETNGKASLELYDRVFTSQVVSSSRLESFEFRAAGTAQPFPAPSLKPLEHLRSISSLLARSPLSTLPDFSVLNDCSELTGLLEAAAFTSNQQQQQQQQQIVVDLSTMPCLTSLGPHTLSGCNGVHTLVLPPTLRTVGSAFCYGSTVEKIDFSLCADSLRFVETHCFLSEAYKIETFSTLPLLGKIGTVVEDFFLMCENLRHVDLRGLQGVVEIKTSFLGDTAVEELDLSALSSCTKIGNYFLSNCRFLKKVTGGLGVVVSVGKHFLRGTEELQEFDFLAMEALVELNPEGLLEDSALEERGTKLLKGIIERKYGSERVQR